MRSAAFTSAPALRRGRWPPWMPATSSACARLLAADPTLVHARTNLDPPYPLLHRRDAAAPRRRESRSRAARRHASAAAGQQRRHRARCSSTPAPTSTPRRSARTAATRWACSSRASRRATRTSSGRSSTCCSSTARTLDLTSDGLPRRVAGQPRAARRGEDDRARRAARRARGRGARPDGSAARRSSTREGRLLVSPAPARQGDDRARRDRAGAALRLRPRAARGRRLPAREGRQLGHDRRQQRRRAASRRVRRRSRDGAAPRGEGRRHQQPGQSVQLDAARLGRPQQPGGGRAVDAGPLRDRLARRRVVRLPRARRGAACARIPTSVNRRIDHWDIPQGTPLHWAAAMGHEEAATAPPREGRRSERPGGQRPHAARCR